MKKKINYDKYICRRFLLDKRSLELKSIKSREKDKGQRWFNYFMEFFLY